MDKVLKQRTITGVIFGIVVISLLLTGRIGLNILCGIVGLMGIIEYHLMTKKAVPYMVIGILVFGVLMYMSIFIPQTEWSKSILLASTLLVYAFFILNVISTFRIDHEAYLPYISLIYPGISMCLPIIFLSEGIVNAHFWFYIIPLIWVSDVGAYLVGRKLGKNKLAPSVSPGKSIEGALGAGALTIICSIIAFYVSRFGNLGFWIFIGIFVWVFGTLGDLYESTIKRKYQVKDSGTILPGHGGFLDRFDSFIFVVPFILLLLKLFKLL
jgi:phosphatidate cytidylyltransferase